MTETRLRDDTLATVLICGGLTNTSVTPLSQKEWNDLVRAMMRAGWRPGDLLRWGMAAARDALPLDAVMADRLDELLGQAVAVAAEIERLENAGIGVLSRADEAYPSRWRSRLREQSPPLVYVAGPVSLLERGGIAAVGSREVDEDGAAFARAAGRAAARAGTPMISGGARGVDREAMFSAIDADGEAVGIMPNGLARALRTTEVRRRVGAGQLTLASPHRPNSGFEVWKAMGRNKLIYALADVSLVISSEAERGGTWAGAIENMRHDWSPLFVRAGPTVPAGNRRLLELGALPIDESDFESVPRPRVVEWLLDRAKRESVDTAAQQSLLDDEDNLPAPSRDSPGRDESAGASDSPPADPDPSQLRLLERF